MMINGLPKIGTKEIVYENKYQQIYRVKARFKNHIKEYYITESGRRAGIVVIKDKAILLVKQYRFLINDLAWEIPGGKVEKGEIPEAAAVRECMEETGVLCQNPRPLINYHLDLDTAHNPTHIFYTDESVEDNKADKIKVYEVSGSAWVPIKECFQMIKNKRILDSFSIIALFAYQNK